MESIKIDGVTGAVVMGDMVEIQQLDWKEDKISDRISVSKEDVIKFAESLKDGLKQYMGYVSHRKTWEEEWFVITAESKEEALGFIMKEYDKDIYEFRAVVQMQPNSEKGISHKFNTVED